LVFGAQLGREVKEHENKNRRLLPKIMANILIVVGVWLTGIEIGSWRFGGVGWAWGSTLG